MDADYLYLPGLLVIAIASLLAIYSQGYDDNLAQRIGLSMTCFGAVIRIYAMFHGQGDSDAPRLLLLYGVAFFALGTVWKHWRIHRRFLASGDRRSTACKTKDKI